MRSRRLAVSLGPCRNLAITERTIGLFHPMRRFPVDYRVLNFQRRNRTFHFWEFAAQILLVPRQDPRIIPATERQSAVTIEFDLVNPVTGRHGADELCFHRLDVVRETAGSGGAWFHKYIALGTRRRRAAFSGASANPSPTCPLLF
jgi:hypothetical protein